MFFRLRQDPEPTISRRGSSPHHKGDFQPKRRRRADATEFRRAERFEDNRSLPTLLIAKLRDILSSGRTEAARTTAGDDWRMLCEAARAAEVSEFDLFRAAWTQWHGTRANQAETSRVFGACLNGAALPAHVRHFVRRLHSAANDPALAFDRERFGLDRYRRVEPLPDLF